MSLSTYADLLSALATYAIRGDQAANWPSAVALAEAMLNRNLKRREMTTVVSGSIGGATEQLPADFNGVRALRLTSGTCAKLEPVTIDEMDLLKARADRGGEPQFYAVTGGAFEVHPEPNGATPYQLRYYQLLPPLEANGSNWLMVLAPDAYLYAALVHFGIMVEDQRLAQWEQALEEILAELRDSDVAAAAGDRLTPATNIRTA
jgi:hypothetical protein